METYLVGGAVRDKLLGLDITERDWVVVGSTPEAMRAAGFQPVGKDFPVFLHPETQEEYALARTERKQGRGYKGFTVYADKSVTLEDDLLRRDLTINAMAEDSNGQLIDPLNGQQDLQARILRHVSPAFIEDPLRVLRLARFAARFAHLGFTIAPETKLLLLNIVRTGELNDLTPERVWRELEKALMTQTPSQFFKILRNCGALKVLMPELDNLFGVPNPPKWHPEIDSGVHSLMVLEEACLLTQDKAIRFGALIHDLGKAITTPTEWPRHIGHDVKGVKPIKTLGKRYRIPKEYLELSILASELHIQIHKIRDAGPKGILKLLLRADAFRRPERFEKLLLICQSDAAGRTLDTIPDYPQADFAQEALGIANKVDYQDLIKQGLQGEAFGTALYRLRLNALKQWQKNHNANN